MWVFGFFRLLSIQQCRRSYTYRNERFRSIFIEQDNIFSDLIILHDNKKSNNSLTGHPHNKPSSFLSKWPCRTMWSDTATIIAIEERSKAQNS